MKNTLIFLTFFSLMGVGHLLYAQSAGDFRSKQSGNWSLASTWQRHNGSTWVDAGYAPSYTDGSITLQAGHTVTADDNIDIDQTVINGTLNINTSIDVDIRDGSGTDLQVYGTINNYGSLSLYSGGDPVIEYKQGSLYNHAQNGGTIEDALWHSNSTCEITGVTVTKPLGLDQSFGNFTWNCTSQTEGENLAGNLVTINGNFTLASTNGYELQLSSTSTTKLTVGGNFSIGPGCLFVLSGSSADNRMDVNGNFTMTGGTFVMAQGSAYDTVNLKGNFSMSGSSPLLTTDLDYIRPVIIFSGSAPQTFTRSSGSIYYGISFLVKPGSSLDLGTSVLGDYNYTSGTFTLESGATLKTAHIQGISANDNSGCIRTIGARTFHASANYHYYAAGSQITGTGLPTSVNGILTIGSVSGATTLTLTNNLIINNKLILVSSGSANSSIVSGTITYGSTATLEYQGGVAQTTANREFPATSGPYHLNINNSSGVNLHANRTLGGTLYLTAGSFAIGSDTLTLNGTISQSDAGNLTGGATSSLFFGGTTGTALPGVELYKLLVNKPGGITLQGNVTIHNNLTLTSGSVTPNGYTLAYATDASLRYNGSSKQTTSSTEFPASSGPTNLFIDNVTGVDLHADRTLNGNLALTGGNFSLLSTTLTLNGTLSGNISKLTGGTGSRLVIGGSGASLDLPGLNLSELTLQRGNGITLNGIINIYSALRMVSGSITLNGHSIIYQSGAKLIYQGSGQQTTSDEEFPEASGPSGLQINNAAGVILHAGRVLTGPLEVLRGEFQLGNHTLSIGGQITKPMAGSIKGGSNSNLVITESITKVNIPLITDGIGNLQINRSSGAILDGNLVISGILTLTNGIFEVSSYSLTLNNPINTNPQNLITTGSSTLVLSGTVSGMDIGPFENIRCSNLGTLIVSNTHSSGITLKGNLTAGGSVQIQNGSIFNIDPGSKLTASILQLNGSQCMVIRSNAFATGSVMVNSVPLKTGSVKMERYIEGYMGNTDGWHLIASPVPNFNIPGSTLEPGDNDDLFRYDEETNMWLNYKQSHFSIFEAGYGYLTAFDETGTRYFSGTPQTENITIENLSVTEDRGWHILGNPFTCSLLWNHDSYWKITGINLIAKIFSESLNNFVDLETDGVIPPHQGFVVEALDPGNSLMIPLEARIHSDENWYKKIMAENTLTLHVQSATNNSGAQARIRFHDNATPWFDPGLDAHAWSASAASPRIFSMVGENEYLSTNSVPVNNLKDLNAFKYLNDITEFTIGFIKGAAAQYTLTVTGLETFPAGTEFIIKDLKLNVTHDINQSRTYSFSSAGHDDVNRFKLVIGKETAIEEHEMIDRWRVLYQDGILTVTDLEGMNPAGKISLFTADGKRILTGTLTGNKTALRFHSENSGIFIFKIQLPERIYSEKIFITQ